MKSIVLSATFFALAQAKGSTSSVRGAVNDQRTRQLPDDCAQYSGQLYAKCNTYCVTKNCGVEDNSGCAELKASAGVVLFPCDLCPCWEESELTIVTSSNIGDNSCIDNKVDEFLAIRTGATLAKGFGSAPATGTAEPTCRTGYDPSSEVVLMITPKEEVNCRTQVCVRCGELFDSSLHGSGGGPYPTGSWDVDCSSI